MKEEGLAASEEAELLRLEQMSELKEAKRAQVQTLVNRAGEPGRAVAEAIALLRQAEQLAVEVEAD